MSTLSGIASLPPEVIETPGPVVAFVGLDLNGSNLNHKSIWDAFNTNRKGDRVAIHFKVLPANNKIPPVKPKRQSYEWYHPKGILKRNWLQKHLHVVPAMIVVFQDLEWSDIQWAEKQQHCVQTIQTLKKTIQGRQTRLAIVILQKNAGLSDDAIHNDRISSLATLCDMNQKMIFTLPYNDNLMGYTLRLESAFMEHAQSYYTQLSRQVRAHRDQLTSTHQELKIRHQFKLGFYAEMRADPNTAIKHYNQAYEWLEEIRLFDTNCMEIKTVAGFLNHKICKLRFNVGSPRDAITQFRTHIDKYRSRVGFKELIFEHYDWLSIQFSAFADLFCDAIKSGLPALQTQHPGIYYHKAAEYVSKRKEAVHQCCSASSPLVEFLPMPEQNLENYARILYSDFCGVRGVGSGNAENFSDQQMIAIVQQCEKSVNHSELFIRLLGTAMAQFKIYKCLRFRKKLAIDMAEEYLKIGDSGKALTLYSLMLADYRMEKWSTIFMHVLLKTLRSAFLSASVADFIACSLECLSSKILMDHSDRIMILENLWKVFQKVPPMNQSQIVPELRTSWETALMAFNKMLVFDLDKMTKLFDCMVKFQHNQIMHDGIVCISLFIRSISDVPLKLREFKFIISDSKELHLLSARDWTEILNVTDDHSENEIHKVGPDFMLNPGKLYRIVFAGEQYQFTENAELQINRLEFRMGTADSFITLQQNFSPTTKNSFKLYNSSKDSFNNMMNDMVCYIVPVFHLSAEAVLSHQSMVTNEYFGLTCKITNESQQYLENVTATYAISDSLRSKGIAFIVSDSVSPRPKLSTLLCVDIGKLAPNTSKTIRFHVISFDEGTIEISQLIKYQTANANVQSTQMPQKKEPTMALHDRINHNVSFEFANDAVLKSKKTTITIPCSAEFLFTGKFYSLDKSPLVQAYKNEDFLFRAELAVKSVDIDILDMYLLSNYNIIEKPYNKPRRAYGQTLRIGQKMSDVCLLNSERTTRDWISKDDHVQQKIAKKPFGVVKALKPTAIVALNKSMGGSKPDQVNDSLSTSGNLNGSFLDSSKILWDPDTIPENTTKEAATCEPKVIYNNAIDAITLTGNRRGFLNTKAINLLNSVQQSSDQPIVGIYCIRWRRNGEKQENESKFVVNCVEIIDAPLNLYCYLDEKMYVKVPMTLTIQLKNTSNRTIHLKSYLKNADSFMFAGHSQLNISLFAQSTYDLHFNLYPLKAGWQQLPEFELKYHSSDDVITEKRAEEQSNNLLLQKLVQRWVPKRVFILVFP